MVIKTTQFRAAFTMIELIFIIVILGILFAIALPRLFAVRDDAKISADIANMAICIKDAGGTYGATGIDLAAGDSKACDAVTCYTITYGSDGSNFIVATNPSAANYCSRINTLGGHLAKTYTFKGTSVSY